MRKRSSNKILSKSFLVALLLTFALSLGVSYFFMKGKFEFDTSFMEELASKPVKTKNTEQKEVARRLYETGTSSLPSGGDPNLERKNSLAAAEDLIKKRMDAYGASLLDLYMDNEGVLYVDIGDELKKKFRGDASEELNIVAGLFRDIEAAVPGFTALKILINGHEADTIGGHIDISKPIGREIAEDI